jgi:hypothetical protein
MRGFIGFIWHMMGTNMGFFCIWYSALRFCKRRGIYIPVDLLSPSQEIVCSMQFIHCHDEYHFGIHRNTVQFRLSVHLSPYGKTGINTKYGLHYTGSHQQYQHGCHAVLLYWSSVRALSDTRGSGTQDLKLYTVIQLLKPCNIYEGKLLF